MLCLLAESTKESRNLQTLPPTVDANWTYTKQLVFNGVYAYMKAGLEPNDQVCEASTQGSDLIGACHCSGT